MTKGRRVSPPGTAQLTAVAQTPGALAIQETAVLAEVPLIRSIWEQEQPRGRLPTSELVNGHSVSNDVETCILCVLTSVLSACRHWTHRVFPKPARESLGCLHCR